MRHLNKIGFENKNSINDLINLTTAQMEKKLFGKKNAHISHGIMLYSVMKLYFLILEKVERNEKKEKGINLQKQEKESIK